METAEKEAQEYVRPEPVDAHRWLHRLIGEWRQAATDGEAGESTRDWTESVTPVGDLWIMSVGQGASPHGTDEKSVMMLGYDPDRERFVGTWAGSMMTYLWIYEGYLDESQRSLILECEGPSFTEAGKMDHYRDIIEFVSDDHRIQHGQVRDASGEWKEFMNEHYRRIR